MMMPDALVQACFEDDRFEDRYQRNNKRGGLKNLRCFPICSAQHKERGFCGRSVVVNVQGPLLEEEDAPEIVAIAEFVPADATETTFTPGCSYPQEKIDAGVRTSEFPLRPLMQAVLVRKDDGEDGAPKKEVFEFNRRRKGWHYGWAANKHSCNTLHCLRVYILARVPGDKLVCLSTFASSSFVLYCRRRRRFVKEIPASAKAEATAAPANAVSSPEASCSSSSPLATPEAGAIQTPSPQQSPSPAASGLKRARAAERPRVVKAARTSAAVTAASSPSLPASDSESEATVILDDAASRLTLLSQASAQTPTGLWLKSEPLAMLASTPAAASSAQSPRSSSLDLAHFLVSLSKGASSPTASSCASASPNVSRSSSPSQTPSPTPSPAKQPLTKAYWLAALKARDAAAGANDDKSKRDEFILQTLKSRNWEREEPAATNAPVSKSLATMNLLQEMLVKQQQQQQTTLREVTAALLEKPLGGHDEKTLSMFASSKLDTLNINSNDSNNSGLATTKLLQDKLQALELLQRSLGLSSALVAQLAKTA